MKQRLLHISTRFRSRKKVILNASSVNVVEIELYIVCYDFGIQHLLFCTSLVAFLQLCRDQLV